MCRPVAIPAQPRILAGRRFLRISPNISPNISPHRGGAGFPGDPNLSTQRDFCGAEIGILSTQRIRGGDLEKNRHFIEGKLVAHGQIFNSWGAMRQKIATFKKGNSVCRVHFFQELSFYIQKELINDFCMLSSLFRSKLICFLHKVFLRKLSRTFVELFSRAKITTHLRIRLLTVNR